LNPKDPTRRGLRKIVRKELRRGIKNLRRQDLKAVHDARKRVKKVRSVVQLLGQIEEDSLSKDAGRLKTAGQTLSTLRDADAVIASFDLLRHRFPTRLPEHTYAILRRQLLRVKDRAARQALARRSTAHVARTLRAVRRSAKRWRVPAIEVRDWPNLLTNSYRASRRAMRRAQAEMSPAELHRWRKRLKTLWYQLRLAESLAPGLRRETRQFKQLQAWLGEDHNQFVLQATLTDEMGWARMPAAMDELVAISGAVQNRLRRKAFVLGHRLLADKPKIFTRRLRDAFSSSPGRSLRARQRASSAAA
jgi:CHAD domain-containing protein